MMSEKRYYVNCAGYLCDKNLSNTLSIFECADLLNQLTKENEQLKEERNYFERKKCEYFNKYNKKHLDNIQLKEENERLRTQLLICQQSKNDDGRFQVWEIPPITSGMRVSTTTINNEQKRF